MLIRTLYTILLTLASPLLLLGLYKSRPNKPKFGPRWKEHFGITPKLKTNEHPIWIHAVSVGESIAAIPLIRALKKQNPEQAILVTTTTSTGAEQIAKLGDLVEHRYMPIDFRFAVKGFLKSTQPKQMLIIETELWPNTLNIVHKLGISIIVINGRLSEKSCRNYSKIKPLFDLLQPTLTRVLCQTAMDAERFERLGLAKNRISVTGSIKFDIQISDGIKSKSKELRYQLGKTRPIWIAASTHKGEDEQILEAHKEVLKSFSNALLILVPRHPERFDHVFELCQENKFKTVRRTAKLKVTESTQIYIGDTMGEMLVLLGSADICFMGGSLIGDKVGGHNVLEPAALGIPILSGPSYFNFKEISESLFQCNALQVVCNTEDLARHLIANFNNFKKLRQNGERGHRFVLKNQGALERTLRWVIETTQ